MAFVLEDGTGKADANAYVTPTEVRNYWADAGFTFAASDDTPSPAQPITLQVAIVQATRYIELRFRSRFKGAIRFPATNTPAFAGQALSWPRQGVYYSMINGGMNLYPYTDYCQEDVEITGVPKQLKDACCEYVKRVFTAPLLTDPVLASNIVSQRSKVGPIETDTQFVPGAVPKFKPYPSADLLLRSLIITGSFTVR